ncbi:MAG: phage tail tape measure protein [Pseudomonadota bacterium]
MADLNTRIIVSARDEATAIFKRVSTEADTLASHLSSIQGIAAGSLAAFGFGSAISDATKNATDFETALWQTSKVTSESMESIRSKILEMPSELGTATELTEGYYQVMSAGVTEASEAMDMLTVASQTAKAAGVTQAEAINALAKIMNGYGDEITDVSTAANMLFGIEKLGMTNVRELAPLMGDLSGVAKALGVDYASLAGSMALITQTSGTSSTAATRLNALFMEMMKPSANLEKALKAVGAASVESLVEAEGWAGTLRQIEEGASKTGQSLATVFGSSEAYQAFIKLMKDDFTYVENYTAEILNTTDALSNAFGRYSKIVQGQYDILQNSLTNLSIRIGESFGGVTSGTLSALNTGLESVNTNFELVKDNAILLATAFTTLTAVKKLAVGESIALAAEDVKLHGVKTTLIERTLGLDSAQQKRLVTQAALKTAIVQTAQAVVTSAAAELKAAQAAVTTAEGQLAAARAAGTLAVSQRQVRQAAILERNALIALDVAKVDLITKTNALSVAQGRLSTTITTTSASISRASILAKTLGTNLLTALGGPVGLAITGVTTGLMYMAIRETEAEKAADSLRKAQEANSEVLKLLSGSQDDYNEALSKTVDLMQELAVEKATEAMRQSMSVIKNEIKAFTEESRSGFFGANINATIYASELSELKSIMAAVDAGTASAEDFAEELTTVIRRLEETGKEGTQLHAALKSLFTENHISNILSAQNVLRDALSPKQATTKVDTGEENKGGTPKSSGLTGGTTGTDEAQRRLEQEAAAIASLERELQKFSMSDQDFQEWDLTNTILPQLMEKTGNATELVNAFADAQRQAWNDAAVQAAMQSQAEAMRQQQELYSKLAELSGDWKASLDLQNKAIEEEANKLREALPELTAYIDEWERLSKAKNEEAAAVTARTADYDARIKELSKDEYYSDPVAGIEIAWLKATSGLDGYRDQMQSTFTDAFSTIQSAGTDAFTELFTTGKLEVDSFFASLASQIATMAAQAAANSLISGIFSALSSSFSYGTSSATSGAVSSIVASVFHDGGTVGAGGASSYVPASVFAGAKRYHTGGFLAADEVPIIAQTGENIISRSDSGNLGGKLDKIASLLTSQNSGTSTSESGGNINIAMVDDGSKIDSYFQTAKGSKTFTTMLNNNRQSIKNVANGGRA